MKIAIYKFKVNKNEKGSLVALEQNSNVPFEIKRVYYIYGANPDSKRGLHAHKKLEQILICVHGSCKILLDNGHEREVICLEKPYEGLYVSNNMWREMFDFSEDAVLLVLASELYDESDYIRDYDEFLKFIEKGN